MHVETNGRDLTALLDLYNKEIDTLKSKLLNGIPWEDLVTVRKNITELAIAIHKSHNSTVTNEALSFKKTPRRENVIEQ